MMNGLTLNFARTNENPAQDQGGILFRKNSLLFLRMTDFAYIIQQKKKPIRTSFCCIQLLLISFH